MERILALLGCQVILDCYLSKFKAPGLQYEVALCRSTGDIVWTSGPHAPRIINELQIFCFRLKHQLDYYERVEADDGYIGECPMCCKCPNGPDHLQDQELINESTRLHRSQQHETVQNFWVHEKTLLS